MVRKGKQVKNAIKYIYPASPFYVHFKKHICPQCGTKVKLSWTSKLVKSNSSEARGYNFSNGDTFFAGNVEFRTRCFYCPKCQKKISFSDMKSAEKRE